MLTCPYGRSRVPIYRLIRRKTRKISLRFSYATVIPSARHVSPRAIGAHYWHALAFVLVCQCVPQGTISRGATVPIECAPCVHTWYSPLHATALSRAPAMLEVGKSLPTTSDVDMSKEGDAYSMGLFVSLSLSFSREVWISYVS